MGEAAGAFRRPDHSAALALGLLMAVALATLMLAGRHLTFFYDEWDFIVDRRGAGLGTFLDPHNEHIALFGVIVYKLLFAIVGLRHYWPYRMVAVILHLLCAALLYLLLRRRLGPWTALAPVALLLFMGSAYQDLLWPFQIGWLASVAGGLGAFVLLERPGRRSDVYATLLLIWSLSGSAVGLAFLVAAAALLLLAPGGWHRWWVVVVPGLLFAIWYVGWGSSEPITSNAVLGAPQYVADAGAGAAAGLAGLGASWGPPLAVVALVLIARGLRNRGAQAPPHLAAVAAVGAIAFWGLAAIARADYADPNASRYLYVGGVFILLAAAEARLGVGVRGASLAGVGVLLVGAVIGNISMLRAGERGLRSIDTTVRASLAVVELAAPVASPAFVPEPVDLPHITAGRYLAAVRALGSPALTLTELQRSPESLREHSDAVLVSAERLTAVAAQITRAGSTAPAVDSLVGGRLIAERGCDRIAPSLSLASLDLRFAPGGKLVVHAGPSAANVYLRRFASTFAGAPLAEVPPGASRTVQFPVDRAPRLPWHVQIVAARAFTACAG
jgi:hypothetical protein